MSPRPYDADHGYVFTIDVGTNSVCPSAMLIGNPSRLCLGVRGYMADAEYCGGSPSVA